MDNYVLGVDVWEGQLDIDEPILKQAGVGIIIIRLNDMNGGHHLDTNFYAQWDQSSSFIRVPYFVYNPWATGSENYSWLAQYMPLCSMVFVDIEVKKEGYSPVEYYNQLMAFLALAKKKWKVVIYTGAWFLSVLSQWPKDYDYWYARYPYIFYPAEKTYITWEALKDKINKLLVWSPGTTPGPCKLWQFSGDRLILPGTTRAIDLNLWNGTLEDLRVWTGQSVIPELRWDWAVDAFLRERLGYNGPGPGL